ncbi:MAG: hypothetical protein ACM3X9_00490 [Bacillota bacterium]
MESFLLGLVFLASSVVRYRLDLAFIGAVIPFKRTILPVLVLAAINYMVTIVIQLPVAVNMMVMLIAVVAVLNIFNKIQFLFSLTGSLLGYITFGVTKIIIVWPLLQVAGISFNVKPATPEWISLGCAEIAIPVLVILILKHFKLSLMNLIK